MTWPDDEELFALIRETLYTPVVGDILDAAGYWRQFLPQAVRPLREDMKVVGRAMPVLIADAWGPQRNPFGRLTEALDQIQPGEIYLATGGSRNCAAWGEILTATARARGGAGAVLDGYHRDTPRVLEQNWPVFSRGAWAQDAAVRSSVIDYRCPIEICGVRVNPGDLVFGDMDGVVVVPRAAESEIVTRALEKARGEKVVRREIEAGASCTETFRKYGIL
ncbi:MAG: RraA family protein [Bryobacteraceae bacterium]|jgi:regulator of RNase E activity RraA